MYSTTTYPTLVLGAALEVFPFFVVLLLLSSMALSDMVTSGSVIWSCYLWLPMVFWVVTVLVLLLPAWMLLLSMFSPWLLLINLFCTLFMAQGGYLHLTKPSLRYGNSFWSNSGLVQTVLALWE